MRAIDLLTMKAALPLLACGVTLALAGCGTPGAPMPPSLKLPVPVSTLSAVRTGSQVSLVWVMPKKTTDKLPIKGNIPVRICRREGAAACEAVPGNQSFPPGSKAAFTETLPAPLASGAARPLAYYVELLNAKGRSAGQSNAARVLAGEAPAPVQGLSSQLRKDGVVLHWTVTGSSAGATIIRLHRTLLTPPTEAGAAAKQASQSGILAPPKEQVELTLLVDSPTAPGKALDKTIHFGRTYEYRAQRIARITVEGETVELPGPLSAPIRVEAIDTLPPAVPTGLAAVATAADAATPASIDLSWLPVTEADLAGYAVYRREGDGDWQRISPSPPSLGPAFHDAQVQPGHTYRYAVSAIDHEGHESAHSAEADEAVPNN